MEEQEEEERERIPCEAWFEELAGLPEESWRARKGEAIRRMDDGSLAVINLKTGAIARAGTFSVLRLADLIADVESRAPARPADDDDDDGVGGKASCVLRLLTRADQASRCNVSVAALQANRENRHAVFQVASNFNGVEAISEYSTPDRPSFTADYIYDITQGPAASVSAGAAAITRVNAAFFDPSKDPREWSQTADRQVEFLAGLQEHFPVRNGYVVLTGSEPEFPAEGSPEYEALLGQVCVGYHHRAQVTTGFRENDAFEVVRDPEQMVDQVFCAAMNIGQGTSGRVNRETKGSRTKCQFILDADYEATFLSAIKHEREHLFLTLIGGGVFNNSKQSIYQAILRAHQKWARHPASTLKTVSIVLYSPHDLLESFPALLKEKQIPFEWVEYQQGEPVLKDHHRA